MIKILPAQDGLPERVQLWKWPVERRALTHILVAYLATRFVLFFIILVSMAAMPMRLGQLMYSDPNNLLLDGLVRDDSWWYFNIVSQGYSMGNINTGAQGNAAFFPLYPILISLLSRFVGSPFLAAILISNLAFIALLAFFYGLTRREFDDDSAGRAVFYLAAAPASVYFSAMYTESLFLTLVAATFYFACEAKWRYAALAGLLASATRNTGILMVVVILLEGLHQNGVALRPPAWSGEKLKEHFKPIASQPIIWQSALIASLGLIGYMLFLKNRFGDPLGFIHVQATWGRTVGAGGLMSLPRNVVTSLNLGENPWAGQFNPRAVLDLAFTLAFLPLVVWVARTMRPTFSVYAVLTFLVPLTTGTVGSMSRYVLMLLPCFMLLAKWGKRDMIDRLVLAAFLPLMAYIAILFSHWYAPG